MKWLMKTLILFFLTAIVFVTSCQNQSEQNKINNKNKGQTAAFEENQTVSSSGSNKTNAVAGNYSLSIKLIPFIPDYPDLGTEGKQLLATRLNSAVSKIGYGGDGANPRFIIGPSINILSKNDLILSLFIKMKL